MLRHHPRHLSCSTLHGLISAVAHRWGTGHTVQLSLKGHGDEDCPTVAISRLCQGGMNMKGAVYLSVSRDGLAGCETSM